MFKAFCKSLCWLEKILLLPPLNWDLLLGELSLEARKNLGIFLVEVVEENLISVCAGLDTSLLGSSRQPAASCVSSPQGQEGDPSFQTPQE